MTKNDDDNGDVDDGDGVVCVEGEDDSDYENR